MAVAEKEYARLPGTGLTRGGESFLTVSHTRCTLWLGSDHLLQVESHGGYTESYKRFYFLDIQALILRKTRKWAIGSIIWGVLLGLCVLGAVTTRDSTGVIVWLSLGGFFLLGLLLFSLPGATCTCHIKTAVHLEELPSLRRLRRARKVIQRLKPFIEQAQGTLAPETALAQFEGVLQQMRTSATATDGLPEAKPYRSRMHQILFCVLSADAVVCTLNIFLPSVPIILCSMVVGAAVLACVVLALVRQTGTDLSPAVRGFTWAAAGYTGLSYLVGYIMMVISAEKAGATGMQLEYIKYLASLEPLQTPWLLTILLVSAGTASVLSIGGLLLLQRFRKAKLVPSVPPPPPPEIPSPV